MVSGPDRPAMTVAVDLGRTKQTNHSEVKSIMCRNIHIILYVIYNCCVISFFWTTFGYRILE